MTYMAKFTIDHPHVYRYYENEFFEWMRDVRELSDQSILSYTLFIRKLHDFLGGYKPLDHFDTDKADQFLLHTKGMYSRSTRNIILAAMRIFGKFKNIPIEPNTKIKMSQMDFQRLRDKKYLTPEIVKDVRSYIASLPEKTIPKRRSKMKKRMIWEFLLHTGARKGEACNVKVKDIDSDYRSIIIGGSKNMNTRQSNLIWRAVPIFSDSFRSLLMNYIKMFKLQDKDKLFQMSEQVFTLTFSEAVKNTGYSIHPHLCRHYFITRLLEDGIGVKEVALMVGDTVQTILTSYYHPSLESMTDKLTSTYNGTFV